MAWCKKVLPSAHEVYLKGLPPCYPTSTHETHLERALQSFHAMVQGPAVALFAEKLQADCEVVWHAGRQLCDAKSLTGMIGTAISPCKECMLLLCKIAFSSSLESMFSLSMFVVLNSKDNHFMSQCSCDTVHFNCQTLAGLS